MANTRPNCAVAIVLVAIIFHDVNAGLVSETDTSREYHRTTVQTEKLHSKAQSPRLTRLANQMRYESLRTRPRSIVLVGNKNQRRIRSRRRNRSHLLSHLSQSLLRWPNQKAKTRNRRKLTPSHSRHSIYHSRNGRLESRSGRYVTRSNRRSRDLISYIRNAWYGSQTLSRRTRKLQKQKNARYHNRVPQVRLLNQMQKRFKTSSFKKNRMSDANTGKQKKWKVAMQKGSNREERKAALARNERVETTRPVDAAKLVREQQHQGETPRRYVDYRDMNKRYPSKYCRCKLKQDENRECFTYTDSSKNKCERVKCQGEFGCVERNERSSLTCRSVGLQPLITSNGDGTCTTKSVRRYVPHITM